MKHLFFVTMCMAAACNSSQKTVSEVKSDSIKGGSPITFAETITEAELREHLFTYASDAFEGRETGTPGQKKAVAYIKAEYEKLGVPAAKANGDYFQKVPLEMTKLPSGSIGVDGKVYELGTDFITFSKAKGGFDEIVYVGYGIEQGDYSDYKDLDVSGKVVLSKFGEPVDENGVYVLSGNNKQSKWSNMSEAMGKRAETAKAHGAIGMLYLDNVNYARFKGYFDYMKNNNSGQMKVSDTKDGFFNILPTPKMAKAIYAEIDSSDDTRSIKRNITFGLSGENEKIDSENVVAIIKGSEKPNEYVIISSHLDHIGVTADGQINNGADDDGSGTVAMLEIAEAFKEAVSKGQGPKRSIVFLHVTGEEKGLLGSQYYADSEPIFPLANTVANLNIDMIGRIDPKRKGNRNYIYLIGSDKLSTELHDLSEKVNNQYTNLELDYTYNDENDPNRFYYRSDHYNFAKNNIPVIFYFNGTHEDYHRPGDTPDKINYDLLRNRARLIFHTAWEVANKPDRIVVDKAAK